LPSVITGKLLASRAWKSTITLVPGTAKPVARGGMNDEFLATHTNAVGADDLAPGRVGDPCFDSVLVILIDPRGVSKAMRATPLALVLSTSRLMIDSP